MQAQGCPVVRLGRVHVDWLIIVGHGGSFTAEVRRVLFDISISRYQSSFDLYHHSLGTPVGVPCRCFLAMPRAVRSAENDWDLVFRKVWSQYSQPCSCQYLPINLWSRIPGHQLPGYAEIWHMEKFCPQQTQLGWTL